VYKFYRRVTLDRLAELLNCSRDEAEEEVADLVRAKIVRAKIDR
jgi:hypothetical protein